ncbi:MAG: alpha-N-acetylglucosaminidase, partial [Clostridia bacterium]|nr:alpha-N-acetylglucosaminidase [Clostridia bacterium]
MKGSMIMHNLIKRNTPHIFQSFILEKTEKENGKSVYYISQRAGRIVLGGDCKISQAMAYYRYLKEYCGVNISHAGNTAMPEITEAPLPDREIKHIIEQDKRVYMNYCTFGYSCAWWGWDEWEKEIDFMAMNGINMPLAVIGTEAVWFYTLREFKYSENGAMRYLSGPGFWPWQLMGNLCAYFPLSDKKFIDARLELGQKIIARQVELGMTPILQGFSGIVPRSIGKVFKSARLRMVKPWCNFPCTCMLDPLDPLFTKIGTVFLEKQRQMLGAYHYYACDPFHENEPNSKKKNYLADVGKTIDRLYKNFDSESVWVMQSWSLYENIVNAVPKGRLLILDIDGVKADESGGFWGHDFVTGRIHNFGDRTVLHGSMDVIAGNEYAAVKKKYANVCGTGLFPEGIRQNPMLFDLAFEMLTQSGKTDIEPWLENYALRRYGSDEKCLAHSVKLVYETAYSPECTGRETGSVICARPSTHLLHTAPNDTLTVRYDNAKLFEALKLLLQAEKADKDGYEYDVCDLTRQVLGNLVNSLYTKIMKAYYDKDVNTFERCTNLFLKILEDLDALLMTRKELTLSYNLEQAGACAVDEKEKQNFELNLLTQITIWGPMTNPVNYDYAWKEWGGLIETYYLKRWHSFFE